MQQVSCFRTGDLGWIDPLTGLLHIKGRTDLQVKIKGAHQFRSTLLP